MGSEAMLKNNSPILILILILIPCSLFLVQKGL